MARAVIDIGGTSTRYSVFRDGELVLNPRTVETADPESQVEEIVEHLRESHEFDSVGVVTTGTVADDGQSIKRMNICGEELEDVSPEVEERLYFENDVNAAAVGENFFGKGKDYDKVLYITFSTGIASGYVDDGELVHGGHGNFGKTGHYPLDDSGVEWEEVSAGENIPASFQEFLTDESESDSVSDIYTGLSAEEIFDLAEEDDTVRKYVENFLGRKNAQGVSTAALSYDPELIVFGGSIAVENPELFLEPLEENFQDFYPDSYESPDLAVTNLGHDAELYGASVIEEQK